MNYNIHPIFVHLPIVFLFFFAVIKIIPFEKVFRNFPFQSLRRFLLLFGLLGAFMALQTGEIAEHLVGESKLIEVHSIFANISVWVFVALSIGELANLLISKNTVENLFLKKIVIFLDRVFYNVWISKILAFLGFCFIVITGLLGGVIVYGVSSDPLAGFVLKLLNISL